MFRILQKHLSAHEKNNQTNQSHQCLEKPISCSVFLQVKSTEAFTDATQQTVFTGHIATRKVHSKSGTVRTLRTPDMKLMWLTGSAHCTQIQLGFFKYCSNLTFTFMSQPSICFRQQAYVITKQHLLEYSFIHSFILAISIAPLQVLYYSEALPTTARILYRSFTPQNKIQLLGLIYKNTET